MYAIVRTGGKQYKVQKGDVIRVEKMDGKEGDKVTLDDVHLFSDGKTSKIGEKASAKITAEVIEQGRDALHEGLGLDIQHRRPAVEEGQVCRQPDIVHLHSAPFRRFISSRWQIVRRR